MPSHSVSRGPFTGPVETQPATATPRFEGPFRTCRTVALGKAGRPLPRSLFTSPVEMPQHSKTSVQSTKCCASRHEVLRTSREASEGVALHEERSAKYRELKAEGISHPPVRAGRFHDAQVAADASCHHALGSKCRVTRDEGVPPRFEGESRTCRCMALGKAGCFHGAQAAAHTNWARIEVLRNGTPRTQFDELSTKCLETRCPTVPAGFTMRGWEMSRGPSRVALRLDHGDRRLFCNPPERR